MYPWQTDFFLNQYEKAVKRSFGYLLIDLKTTGKETVPLWKSHVRDSLTSHSSGPETHRQTNVKKQLVTPRISQQRIIETVPLWKSQEGLYADLLAWFPLEDPEQHAFPMRHCACEAPPVLFSFPLAGRSPQGLCFFLFLLLTDVWFGEIMCLMNARRVLSDWRLERTRVMRKSVCWELYTFPSVYRGVIEVLTRTKVVLRFRHVAKEN